MRVLVPGLGARLDYSLLSPHLGSPCTACAAVRGVLCFRLVTCNPKPERSPTALLVCNLPDSSMSIGSLVQILLETCCLTHSLSWTPFTSLTLPLLHQRSESLVPFFWFLAFLKRDLCVWEREDSFHKKGCWHHAKVRFRCSGSRNNEVAWVFLSYVEGSRDILSSTTKHKDPAETCKM